MIFLPFLNPLEFVYRITVFKHLAFEWNIPQLIEFKTQPNQHKGVFTPFEGMTNFIQSFEKSVGFHCFLEPSTSIFEQHGLTGANMLHLPLLLRQDIRKYATDRAAHEIPDRLAFAPDTR
jgi:hypothetical protein